MIPTGFLQDLLSRVDIADLVGRHVELKKTGANLMGLCPFHGEKSPSFSVSPSKQFYYCFGCGASGDAIRFLTEHTGLSFPEAVRDLAQQVGMVVPEGELDPEEHGRAEAARVQRATLSEVLARAAAHYQALLKASPRAVDYLKRRGLSGAVAARFGLGYASEGWRGLASAFARYDDPLLVESGLVIVQGEDEATQKRYDRFRDRVMFPIRSVKGEVIGFGGRVLDGGGASVTAAGAPHARPELSQPKYLNSPETPVFSKGRELYGLFEARQDLRTKGYALVVEGYMDVVALAQSGFGNAVATLGTACTADHVKLLLRFTDDVVFSFDGDAAGRRAAGRALEAALPHATDLRRFRFLFLPVEHDPDSFVRSHGADAFETLVAQAVPLSRQLLELAAEDADLDTAEGRARFVAQARPLWDTLPAGGLREQLLGDIADRARLPRAEMAARWVPSAPRAGAEARGGTGLRAPALRMPVAVSVRRPQDQAARILLQRSEWWHELAAIDHELLLGTQDWLSDVFRWLDRWLAEHDPLPWPGLREAIADQPWGPRATALVDGADPPVEPLLDHLRSALSQTRIAAERAPAMTLLGRR